MDTDASNVEDMNIHQNKECLSMSCIASFEEWSNIFRTRSFTLCKNDRDFRESFVSAAVSESISISMTNLFTYRSCRSCIQHFIRFPLLRKPLFVSIPFWEAWWASAENGSHRTCSLHIQRAQRYILTFKFGFHRAWRCSRGKHVRIPHMASWYQIHYRLWFCCDPFFTCIFWRSFRHHFKTIGGTGTADVEQTQKMIPFITCEISLGQYVCEVFFGVNVLDLNVGVQIDSIEQPIKSNSVGSGHMSHCRTSFLYDHLDHCFAVFKDIQQSFLTRRLDVWGNKINIVQIINNSMRFLSFLKCVRYCTNLT